MLITKLWLCVLESKLYKIVTHILYLHTHRENFICMIFVELDRTFILDLFLCCSFFCFFFPVLLLKTFSLLFFFFFWSDMFNLSCLLASVYMNWWLNKLKLSILFYSSKTCIYCCDLSDNLHKVLVSTDEIINSSEDEMFYCFHSSRQFFCIHTQELHRPQLGFWIKMHHWC